MQTYIPYTVYARNVCTRACARGGGRGAVFNHHFYVIVFKSIVHTVLVHLFSFIYLVIMFHPCVIFFDTKNTNAFQQPILLHCRLNH